MRSVLVGNYGVANVGDEALREYFLAAFPMVEWTVLSSDPKKGELPRLPAGIRSFLTTRWWKTIAALRGTDTVIFGGGTLFTDIESPLACMLWFLHARAAYFFGKPYYLAFQGVGPFRTVIGKRLASWVLRHAAFISVRDEESSKRVCEITMNIKCVRTFDPTVLHIPIKNSERTKNVINIIPRHNVGASFFAAAEMLMTTYPDADIHIVLLQPDHTLEKEVADQLQKRAGGKALIIPVTSFSALCDDLSGSLMVLSARYHGAIAALAVGAPLHIISQREKDKLSDLQQYADNPAAFSAVIASAQTGESALREALGL